MKFVYPDIGYVFDFEKSPVYSLIIENQRMLLELMTDIQNQLQGLEGKSVLSEQGKQIAIEKYAECLSQFCPFSINQKSLLNKVTAVLAKTAVNEEYYLMTMQLLGQIEQYLLEIAFELKGDIVFQKVTADALVKAVGVEFRDEYDSLAEKVIDYFELVTELDRKKLFVLYNLRSLLDDEETTVFIDTVIKHGYNVLMIESGEHTLLPGERRYIVDSALCEIG